MVFKLPNGSDLSAEQLDIINLPTKNSYVIQGAPGTGKTVMAIYRAAQLARNHKVLLLVYNRPLMLFLSTATKGDNFKKCLVSTYHQWLSDFYFDEFKTNYPKFAGYEPDWSKIKSDCLLLGKKYKHIIIDEAQDFPIELISILHKLSESITCFVDPNQAIEPGKTGIVDFIKTLCIEAPYTLTRNFRNTKQIRDLSVLYCTKGNPSKAYDIGKKPALIRCNEYEDQTKKMCRIILQNKQKSIGVIVNYENINKTVAELQKEVGTEVDVQYYKSNKDNTLDFENQDGVRIVTYGTMKGLEFDMVLLPRFEKVKSTGDETTDINRIYVATTRAISELFIFYFNKTITPKWIDTFSPLVNNPQMLDWK